MKIYQGKKIPTSKLHNNLMFQLKLTHDF